MKANSLFFIFYILLLQTTYCQTLKGIMTETPIKGTGDNTKLSTKASKPYTYTYIHSEKKSIQKLISIEKSSIDTTYIEKNGNKHTTTSSVSRPSSTSYFKDFNSKTYKVIFTQDNEDVSVKETLPTHIWKLNNEQKNINGYACKKATTTNTTFSTGQHIVAWYTEEIPVNDGPMHYYGLPGFIVQVEIDKATVYTFDKLVFIKENTAIEEPKNSAPDKSYAEYLRSN